MEAYRSGHSRRVLLGSEASNRLGRKRFYKKKKRFALVYMEAYRSGHNEAVLKTVWVKAHGGSNPSASAKNMLMWLRW